MIEKIIEFAKKYDMLQPDMTIIAGLSGGADSVCLTAVLNELSKTIGFAVEAVHVNHKLRGEESMRDQLFCTKLCDMLCIPLTVISCDVNEYALKNKLSTEEAARILRYNAFSEISKGKLIATAHNADDNLETVIHNLTRGTAVKGLSGIPPVRDNIIRPMLTVTRREIEAFLAERSLDYVVDSTNLSNDYTRNKIRHNVIPMLSEINSSVVKTSIGSISAIRLENDFINCEAEKAYKQCFNDNSFTGLRVYHKAVRHRCIAKLLSNNFLSYSYERLEQIDKLLFSDGKINISGDLYIVSRGNKLSLIKIDKKTDFKKKEIPLKIGKNMIFEHKFLLAEVIDAADNNKIININNMFANYYLDYDKIIGSAVIRERKNGDKIQLAGRNFTSSVKKLINEKISPEDKPFLHFIEDEKGTVFAEKLGISQRAAPDELTRRILRITIVENENG